MIDPNYIPPNALQRVVRANPFSSKRQMDYVPIEGDRPLSHYLGRYLEGNVYVYLDGELIPPARLDQVVPRPGQQAVVLAQVAGGDGGAKGILRTIAMIAIAVVAFLVAPYLAPVIGMVAAYAVAGAIMVGGSLAVNALFAVKPPSPSEQLPSYSWGGPLAGVQQGSPILKIYGTTVVILSGYPIGSYTTASGRTMTLDARFSLGWGKLRSVSQVKINDNPASNYPGASIEWRPGTNDQPHVDYFDQEHSQRPQDLRIMGNAGPVEVDGDRTDTQGIVVQLYFPSGVWYLTGKGEYSIGTVQLFLRWRLHGTSGAWSEVSRTYTDNHPSPVYVEVRKDGLAPGKYDIQVEKTNTSGDEDNPKRGTQCWLKAIDEVVYQDFAFPNIAQLAVRAVATDKLSGNIKVSALCEAEVPDTVAGTKLADFDADNPAVICWDALTNDLYGAGAEKNGITPAMMDEDAFAEWAAWCDELVPDGAGGTVKRSTWNGVAGDSGNVWDFVQSVARLSRSVILRTGSKYTVITDKPEPVTQIFTVGNIKRDSFVETWLPLEGRANSIPVTYYDETDDYKRKPLSVDEQGADLLPASAVDLRGCTKAAQAWHWAMYQYRANKYLLRSCQFDAASEAIACVVGNVIGVQHDVPQWGAGGRLVSASGTAVTLDRQVTIEGGKDYVISVMLATVERVAGHISAIVGRRVSVPEFDGLSNVTRFITFTGSPSVLDKDIEILRFGAGWVELASTAGLHVDDAIALWDQNVLETRDVVNVPGTSDKITLATAFSVDPQRFDVYTFGESGKELKKFRVIGIGRTRDNEFTIKGIEYAPELFEDLEPVLPPAADALASKIAVANLEAREFANPTPDLPALAISWAPGPLTEGAYIYLAVKGDIGNGNFEEPGSSGDPADNWESQYTDDYMEIVRESFAPRSGVYCLLLGDKGAAVTIGAHSLKYAAALCRTAIPATAGDAVRVLAYVRPDQNIAAPAGLVCKAYAFLRVTYSDASTEDFLSDVIVDSTAVWSEYAAVEANFDVPDPVGKTVTSCDLWLTAIVDNPTAAPIDTPDGQHIWHTRFDDLSVYVNGAKVMGGDGLEMTETLKAVITGKNAAILPVVSGQTVTVRVVGFNSKRGAAPHTTAPTKTVTISGAAAMPHNITSFRCTAFSSPDATLAWDAVAEAATDTGLVYEIRFTWKGEANPMWERANVVSDTIAHDATGYVANWGAGTYFIKAKNSAGNYSGIASSCVASAAAVISDGDPHRDPEPIGGGGGGGGGPRLVFG